MPVLNSGVSRSLLKSPSGRPEAKKSATSFGDLLPPVRISERDHVVYRPRIVSDDVCEDEARDALGMMNGHDQCDSTTRIMTDKICTVDLRDDPSAG